MSPFSQTDSSLPIGTILPYTGDLANIPKGWYLCDGNNGTPDLSGRFLEGWGRYGKAVGTYNAAGLPNITGTFEMESLSEGSTGGSINTGAFYVSTTDPVKRHLYSEILHSGNQVMTFEASRSNSIYGSSDTVQPASYAVYYIMRATFLFNNQKYQFF